MTERLIAPQELQFYENQVSRRSLDDRMPIEYTMISISIYNNNMSIA